MLAQVLFIVVVIFLGSVLMLLAATGRLETAWHKAETEARFSTSLITSYSKLVIQENALRTRGRCCGKRCTTRVRNAALATTPWCGLPKRLQRVHQAVMFASIRARFIRPPSQEKAGAAGGGGRGGRLAGSGSSGKGATTIELKLGVDKVYRKKGKWKVAGGVGTMCIM